MTMRIAILAAAAMALSFPAVAAQKWNPDYAKSSLQFEGKFGENTVTGTFGKFAADIAFDAKDLATSKVVVTVDMASVKSSVTQPVYNQPTDAALPGAGWFNTAANPKAVFTSTSITSKGGDKYDVKGTLNLRGVTKDVVFTDAVIKVSGNAATAEGTATVSRLDFGIRGDAPQYALPKPVPYEVKIKFSIAASK
jgi:polyisoprenoid-binding protein YceI